MTALPRHRLVIVKLVVIITGVVWLNAIIAQWWEQRTLLTERQPQGFIPRDMRDIDIRLGHANFKPTAFKEFIDKADSVETHTKTAKPTGRKTQTSPIKLDYAILKTHNVVLRKNRPSTVHTWVYLPENVCENKTYGDLSELPPASVVTSFHTHEDLVEILHTLHSLVQRSPARLLREIVIVDDHSYNEAHKTILENYVATVFKDMTIRIYRTPKQLGLIHARNVGVRLAQGPVVVVMDIHFEVQEHWLEALLWEIKQNNRTMASPTLDWMFPAPNGTWTYEHGSATLKTYWMWDCSVGFDHIPINEREKIETKTDSIPNPANMGTFAITKSFFNEIGAYDDDMWGWGGDNLDLSVRVWLFGGRIVKVPCSHMAHLEKKGYRDYRVKWYWQIMANFRRFVDLWGEDYKELFFEFLPDIKKVGAQDLSKRTYLKKKAKYDMSWYLKNVYPELLDTIPNRNSYAFGGLKNVATRKCLDRQQSSFGVYSCHYQIGSQGFFLNTRFQLRHHSAVISSITFLKGYRLWGTTFIRSYDRSDLAEWIHWKHGPIMDVKRNVCLEAEPTNNSSSGEKGGLEGVRLAPCQFHNPFQKWTFRNYTIYYEFLMSDKFVAREGTTQYKMLELYDRYGRPQQMIKKPTQDTNN